MPNIIIAYVCYPKLPRQLDTVVIIDLLNFKRNIPSKQSRQHFFIIASVTLSHVECGAAMIELELLAIG